MSEKPQPDDLASPQCEQGAPEGDDITLLREQIAEALREKDQFRAMAQRAQADLINYRRRAVEEKEDLRRNANSQLLLKILSVVDDLNRAFELVPDDAVVPGWLEGVQLVQRNLENILQSEGLTRIEAEGLPFEPREHEAVLHEETPGTEEGMVVKVIRDGYKLHDRVLRAAQVTVSKAPQPGPDDNQESTQQEA